MPKFRMKVASRRRITLPKDVKPGDLVEITYVKLDEEEKITKDIAAGATTFEGRILQFQLCRVCGKDIDTYSENAVFKKVRGGREFAHNFCLPG